MHKKTPFLCLRFESCGHFVWKFLHTQMQIPYLLFLIQPFFAGNCSISTRKKLPFLQEQSKGKKAENIDQQNCGLKLKSIFIY